jgi:Domain of unknown function (DUF4178)
MAVCSYCRSTLVRNGDTLRRIGKSAELFDDHSPLALGVRGSYEGDGFTLIGRLQYAYQDEDGATGRWASWHALFDSGRSGALSEDNGRYVMSWPQQPPPEGLPDLSKLSLGSASTILGRRWGVASKVQAHVHAMAGEWPFVIDPARTFTVWELRNPQGEVLSIEGLTEPPQLDVGQSVRLEDLRLSGLPEADLGQANIRAKGLECPSCGSGLEPRLEDSKTIVCGQCKAVVDISKGLGADLAYYRQDNSLEPLIALGSRGTFNQFGRTTRWQVVGYQERCNVPTSSDDESWFWREYLLYERKEGFAFLVDAQDGWSIVRPLTGAPRQVGDKVAYSGVAYRPKEASYPAATTYVLGEFYWPVRKGQRSRNTDYAGTGKGARLVMNREDSGTEVNWSQGSVLNADEVMKAFGIDAGQAGLFKRDVKPASLEWNSTTVLIIIMIIGLFILISAMQRCSQDCDRVRDTYGEASVEYRQCRDKRSNSSSYGHGGSWGGYSSGGGHK